MPAGSRLQVAGGCIQTSVWTKIDAHMHIWTTLSAYMHIWKSICACGHLYAHVLTYRACMHIRMSICACMHICMSIWTSAISQWAHRGLIASKLHEMRPQAFCSSVNDAKEILQFILVSAKCITWKERAWSFFFIVSILLMTRMHSRISVASFTREQFVCGLATDESGYIRMFNTDRKLNC